MLPFLKIFSLTIPTFYLVISLTVSLALIWFHYRIKQKPFANHFSKQVGYDLIGGVMISGFIGARLFHIVYEEPGYYMLFPAEMFRFAKGGYVYFGGMIAAMLFGAIYLRIKKESFLKWANFLTPIASLTYALGRIGCFLEGCCYGKQCTLPWAINHLHPTQLYMMIAELVLLFILLKKEKKTPLNNNLFLHWLIAHSFTRFVIEFWRDDHRGSYFFEVLSVSQVISIIITLIATLYIILMKKRQPTK